jgi:two-component system phosphate regulon response regulator PhoB
MPNRSVIIVEDEQDMAELVAMRLQRENYQVDIALDGRSGLEKIRSQMPDLVILDLMLPRMSGTDVAGQLRSDPKTANIPIIMLTAKSEESDIVLGLHVGADDYVTKPFSMSVLIARVAALLRRSDRQEDPGESDVLQAGPIELDRERHRVEVDGKPIQLTLTEFRLLSAILGARGRVLTRNQLIDQALGIDAVVTDRTIDVHMAALRRKLGSARTLLRTVRGIGYRLANEEEQREQA